jgi:hypothetical protein
MHRQFHPVAAALLGLTVALGLAVAPAEATAPLSGRAVATAAVHAQPPTAPARPKAKKQKKTTLRVRVAGVPKHQAVKLVVTGPRHFHKRHLKVQRGKTLSFAKVPTGRYVLRAKGFKIAKGKFAGRYVKPKAATTRITGKHRRGVLTARYQTVLSPRLEVVTQAQIKGQEVSSAPGGAGSLTLTGKHQVGDIVASGPTVGAPGGSLVRLVKKISSTGGATTWVTANVDVTTAVLRASFDKDISVPVSLGADDQPDLDGMPARRAATNPSNPFRKLVACQSAGDGASAELKVQAKVEGAIEAHIGLEWHRPNWHSLPHPELNAGASASLTADATASISGEATCTLEKQDLLATPIPLPPIPVPGLPVTFLPRLQFTIEGQAHTEATLSTGVHASASTSVDATATLDSFKTDFDPPSTTFDYDPPSLTATGSASLHLGAHLDLLANGVAGPYVTAAVGPVLSADINGSPWWQLDANLKVGLGVRADVFGFEVDEGKDDIIDQSWTIARAAGRFGGVQGSDNGGTGHPDVRPALRHIASYGVNGDLRCFLNSQEDEAGEFFAEDAEHQACGTFAVVQGQLYGPADIPAGETLSEANPSGYYTPWTPVSQTESGAGTAASPWVRRTTVAAGATGVQLVQTDRWYGAGKAIQTSVSVRNRSAAEQGVRLYRAFDCYIGDDDTGTGEMSLDGSLVGCLRTLVDDETDAETAVTLRLQALTPGASVYEAYYDDTWRLIGSQQPLPNTCRCDDDIDNSVAVSWADSIPAGQSKVFDSETSMTRPD